MIVHIAPIGKETKHVEEWLREITPVTKIWLIHSKKKDGNVNFNKYAKDLEKKLKNDYEGIEVEHYLIDDPFGIDDTMDAISDIVSIEDDNVNRRQDFAINVTGGTNAMAAGAILQAMLLGTKAHYILNRNKNPGQIKYADELPIPSIGILRMDESQQKVLRIISEYTFKVKKPKARKNMIEEEGVIPNQKLLEELKDNKEIKYGTRKRQKGATKLTYVISQLMDKGYVERIGWVEECVKNVYIGKDKQSIERFEIKKNYSQVKWKITDAGKRRARDEIMYFKRK